MVNRYAQLKVTAVAAAVLVLMGCAPGAGYADLDREASAADTAPADLPDYALDEMDTGTLRFVDEFDHMRVFLAKGNDQPLCILIYVNELDWTSSCGSEMMSASTGNLEVMIVNDATPERKGWTRVSDNLDVKDP